MSLFASLSSLLLRRVIAIAAIGTLTHTLPLVHAEDPAGAPCEVKVLVRTIQAVGHRSTESQADTEQPITVEESLSDLKPKLEMLPFSSFKLISTKEEQISLKKRETVNLPNGQTLAFRPMYMEKERMGIWLSWKDTDGSDILNTRIHFDADEPVVTGTDYHDNEGRILAIKAVKAQ